MTEFEIQRRLRELNTPRTPQVDLWAAIAPRLAGIEAAPIVQRRRRWLPLAAAASLLLAVVAASLVFGVRRHDAAHDIAATNIQTLTPRDARDFAHARSDDPRLVGAIVVLDAAHAELEQALEQRPDAVFLVSLLNRTNMRRMKLDHYGASAG